MDLPQKYIGDAFAAHRKLAASGDPDAALAVLRNARERYGFNIGLDQTEWMFLNDIGRISEMEPIVSRLLTKAPEHPAGHIGACWYYFRMDNIAECLLAAQHLIANFPSIYEGYFFATICLKREGRADETLEFCKQLSANIPERVEGWTGQAEILRDRGELGAATRVLRDALGSVPEQSRVAIIKCYVSTALIEGQSIRDVSTTVLADLEEIASTSAESSAFLVNQLRGRVSSDLRQGVLDRALSRFPGAISLLEEMIREDFNYEDLASASVRLYGLLSCGANGPTSTFLWMEYLMRARRWRELAELLQGDVAKILPSVRDLEQARMVVDCIWLCDHYGHPLSLSYEDVPHVDSRLTRAIAAYRSEDLLDCWDGPLEAWRSRQSKPPYFRLQSFVHPSWVPAIAPRDCTTVERTIMDAYMASRPFSLIRLADCEGTFLNRKHYTLSGATAKRSRTEGFITPNIAGAEYEALRDQMIEALSGADMIGIGNEFSIMVESSLMNCVRYIAQDIPMFGGAFTDHAVHNALGASGFLEKLMAIQLLSGRPIYYIGPHSPLEFRGLAVPPTTIRHIPIPPQVVFFPERVHYEAHYPEFFPRVLDAISQIPPNSLVFIAAGILGKIYCGAVKRQGAFSLDIGAISDHWCGHTTRIAAQHNKSFSSGKRHIEDLLIRE